jgi:hypothetical protein
MAKAATAEQVPVMATKEDVQRIEQKLDELTAWVKRMVRVAKGQ